MGELELYSVMILAVPMVWERMHTLLGLSQLQLQALLVHLETGLPLLYFMRLACSALQLLLNLHTTDDEPL